MDRHVLCYHITLLLDTESVNLPNHIHVTESDRKMAYFYTYEMCRICSLYAYSIAQLECK